MSSLSYYNNDLFNVIPACDLQKIGGKIKSITDLEQYVAMKRKEILDKHKAAFTELRDGKYKGYIQTFVRDESSNKRRVIRAKTRKDLEDKLVSFYTGLSDNGKHTIDECFNEWIEYQSIDKRPSSINYYKSAYKRHFSSVKNIYIEDWGGYEIKVHSKKEIARNKLTQKGYSNYKTVLYGIWHYAKDKKIISYRIEEIADELKRELGHSFYPSKRALNPDDEFVLSVDESNKVKEFCLKSGRLDDLGVAFMLETGIRVGEEVALRKADISLEGNAVYIFTTEERVGSGANYAVSDKPKTEAGIRKVLLTNEAKMIAKMMLEKSNPQSEYLFSDKKIDRYPTKKIRDRLTRICKYVNIKKCSPHTLRRTYITSLYEAGVPEKIIIKQVGHVDYDITEKYYIYDRKTDEEKIAILEKKS